MMTEVVEKRRSIQLQKGHCIVKKVENNGNEVMGGGGGGNYCSNAWI